MNSDLDSLLAPFFPTSSLTQGQTRQLRTYLDLLLRWNQRINLTSVRKADDIVTRHFGESLFLADSLVATEAIATQQAVAKAPGLAARDFVDIGSGAGFPGIPFKIYAPHLRGTLVESQSKKATFLKEVVRTLNLKDIEVFSGRAQELAQPGARRFSLVILRAVERFENVLPVAAGLVAQTGRLALLIGAAQVATAQRLLPSFSWQPARPVPLSRSRVLLIGGAQN